MSDDDHIGPINGHNKSEALPNGCIIIVMVIFGFIIVFGTYGFVMDALK